MPKCAAPHPDIAGLTCRAKAGTFHHDHFGRTDPLDMTTEVYWPNEAQPRPVAGTKTSLVELRDQITPETPAPIRSAVALGRVEPTRGTKQARTLAYLRERLGAWVDGTEIETPEVGGAQGTRRIRELRDMGYRIDTRPNPERTTTWQYRLNADTFPQHHPGGVPRGGDGVPEGGAGP